LKQTYVDEAQYNMVNTYVTSLSNYILVG